MLNWLEGGSMFSETLRLVYEHYYQVTVGAFSYGPGLKPGAFWPGTRIGNFSSIAEGVKALRRNHPTDRLSQHPLFFNHVVGLVAADTIPSVVANPLVIGHDVWIGLEAIICPGCRNIGNGAIIAAGAVVTKDVAPYTIVGGNPARPIRKRFAPEVEAAVAASEWWLRPLPELVQHLDLFARPLTEESLAGLIAAFPARQDTDDRSSPAFRQCGA